jgi:hypothetical protein
MKPGVERTADDLHQRHQRRGVEEMQPGQPFGPRHPRRDGGDGEGGGVGRQDGVGADDAFKLGEQAALDVEILDNRLDHQPGGGKVGQAVHGGQPIERRVALRRRPFAFVDQPVQRLGDGGDGGRRRAGAGVDQPHRMTGLRRDLGDALAHGAAADHADDGGGGKGPHRHRPWNCGARLPTKAATPSR